MSSTMPIPNGWGDHWLGKPPAAPAVFRSQLDGCYFVCTGDRGRGVLFEGDKIKRFDTPDEALLALEEFMLLPELKMSERLSKGKQDKKGKR